MVNDAVAKVGKAAGIFLFVVAFLMVASVVIVQLFPAAKTAVLAVLFISMLVGITCVFLMKRYPYIFPVMSSQAREPGGGIAGSSSCENHSAS